MQTVDSRRQHFLELEARYREFAAKATTEEDKRRWTAKADDIARTAHQKDQTNAHST